MKLALVSAVLLVLVAGLLFTPPGRSLDLELSRRAFACDRASPALHAIMRAGTEVGVAKSVLLGLILPAAFGGEVARGTVRIALPALAGSQGTVEILKHVVRRERPDGKLDTRNASFPSSHASGVAALAWIVAARHRRLGPWIWLVALWVCASRVFLGRHFPSDVLFGALVGIWFAALALRFEERLAGSRRVG